MQITDYNNNKNTKFPKPCACCGEGIISEPHDICPVCGWEDDPVQNEDHDFAGGANRLSLNAYRQVCIDMDNIRSVSVLEITAAVRDMCIEANMQLSQDMCAALKNAAEKETGELGRNILGQLDENLKIAGEEQIPICQDTGMAVVFMDIGQDVHFTGGELRDAVNEGVRRGYEEGYLRKSVVRDPLERINTGDNTPAVLHCRIVPGDRVTITVAPKGFGSENMSRVFMLKPADGEEGVKNAVITAVREAGANACPPMVVGVGVGGDFEQAAMMAKHALTGRLNSVQVHSIGNDSSPAEDSALPSSRSGSETLWARIQAELFTALNKLNIGPGGMGGSNTVLGVNIETYPTHIAGLPVAVNICCHVNRHVTWVI